MKYHIITYGCQMNKSDSERVAGLLEKIGYQSVNEASRADLIVVNMCSVRQSAVDRVYGLIEKFSQWKKNNPCLKTVLTGCFLKSDYKKFKNKFDFIFNIKDTDSLLKIISGKIIDPNKEPLKYLSLEPKIKSPITAYVPIMTGCNNFCAYCVVPYTRGREISRSIPEILNEIKKLIRRNYKEIFLLGQNVNSYRSKSKIKNQKSKIINFTKLLEEINKIPGKFWIRFITSHPKDLSDELIKTMANCKKITEYLHLPVQSSDDQILQKMNRGYTAEEYKKLIRKIRAKIPSISISTDIIVGFPGETKKQFNNTAKLMKWAKFDMAYIARYSPRTGAAAANLIDDVPQKEKKRREKILTKILEKTALENNEKYINKTIEILIEQRTKDNFFLGKTRTFKNVKIPHPTILGEGSRQCLKIGQFAKVKIAHATPWGLEGNIIL